MSSWEGNVQGLIQTGFCAEGAIIDFASGKVYAQSGGLKLEKHSYTLKDETGKDVTGEVDEVSVLKEMIQNKGLVKNPPGIFLDEEGSKMAFLKSEDGGASVTKTGKLIIVGTWLKDKKQNGGDCNTTVESLAKQFIKANY